ncbi:lactonase family protein [Paenibacillus methanolicus]|uniref:6-phosphogluconolactonase n=1 Tax=Paenibacillus methanolicus TaxID=582686 RepID=A0A5S5BLR4_9BACL|nr:lactonase family protein [Paenibacillus methanolicus]TYP67999.1 6-phosphogluconolactonase [Paenibacillus methanolicus]
MKQLFYVGSYAQKNEEGLYAYVLDTETGAMTKQYGVKGVENPSFLTVSKDASRVYAVGETTDERPGTVGAFVVDLNGQGLTPLNEQSSLGSSPCHVVLDPEEKLLVVVNYGGGNLSLYPVMADGSVGPTEDHVRHEGASVMTDRQAGPHPHSSILDVQGRYVLVADLGVDQIVHYELDREAGKLVKRLETNVAPGTGPRHMDFHPSGKWLYLVGELNNTVCVYEYRAEDSALALVQTVSTLPDGYEGVSWSADIHLSASGRFLYTSNRGHDSIAVFAVGENGQLTPIEHVSTEGSYPRNFAITPDDRFLLAANQQSNSIVSYRIDEASGRLTATGQRTEIGAPVCIRFVQA